MMSVVAGKDKRITEVYEKDGAVFFKSEEGLLRIIPMAGGIVRVSFSAEDEFDRRQGEDYADYSGTIDHSIYENPDAFVVSTGEGEVWINRRSGSVSFQDSDRQILLSENHDRPRELEKVTLYRTMNFENAQVEEIATADGVKKRIKAADKEEYGYGFKTRTYFSFGDEALIGFGQGEHGEWNLRNTTYYAHQANRKIAMPLLVSDRKYGILFSTNSPLMFTEDRDKAYVQTEADYFLDYYFLFGKDLFDVVKNYRRLTGKAAMLPMWAFGYIQSKERYESQEDILKAAGEFIKRDIPVDCLVLDWMSWEENKWGQKSFDRSRFPDPKEMTETLRENGIHFMMSIWPNMSSNCEDNRDFKERGLLLPGMSLYNAFSPEGRQLYWSQVERSLFSSGVDAWWCDSSEAITPEWEHVVEPADSEKYYEFINAAASIMPLELANAYSKYHAKTIWDGQRKCTGDKRVVNLTRSGWAGSQKYGTILWSGDISASWKTLEKQVRAALQMAASAVPYWTLDAGAFFVKHGTQWFWDGDYKAGIDDAYRKLYVRWFEYAAFLPVFRAHGTDVEREPWAFGDKGDMYYEALCKTIRNRYRLMPYIYSTASGVYLEDSVIIRPLMFDYPEDCEAVQISDQYMFGDNLMICPVVSEKDLRMVYLPGENGWFDYYNNCYYEGGQTIECICPLENIPVFVKAGSMIPTTAPMGNTKAIKGADIDVLIYPGHDAVFSLYEDAGDGYGYEKGEYCITELKWDDSHKTFSCSTRGDERFRLGKITYTVISGT
jgi:alpha-D-xyloside xylohydrolase